MAISSPVSGNHFIASIFRWSDDHWRKNTILFYTFHQIRHFLIHSDFKWMIREITDFFNGNFHNHFPFRFISFLLNDIRHRECLARSSDTKKGLTSIAFPEAFYKLLDSLRLVLDWGIF